MAAVLLLLMASQHGNDIAAAVSAAAPPAAAAAYTDNTDELLKKIDLRKYHALFTAQQQGVLRQQRMFPDAGSAVVSAQAAAMDDRIFLGEALHHTQDNCFIIRLRPNANAETLKKVSQLFYNLDGTRLKQQLESLRSAVVCFQKGTLPARLLCSISGLEMVERDCRFQTAEPQFEAASDSTAVNRLSSLYDDGGNDRATTAFQYTGKGVNVYVVDSGIDTRHAEFEGRASIGYSIFDGALGEDCSGHGTSVASCVGGKSVGVAPGVSLISVQVLDCAGSGTTSGMLSAIEWLKRNARRPCVVNMSFVGGRSPSLDWALSEMVSSGIPVTIAAGNFNRDAALYSPNGRELGAISVGAVDAANRRSSFSNYGATVDIFAPGSRVAVAVKGGGYGVESGTSFSAPLAAGAVAMVLQRIPNCPSEQLERIIRKISDTDILNMASLNGSPNRFLQVPHLIANKADVRNAKYKDDRVATFSSFVISPTPLDASNNSTDRTDNGGGPSTATDAVNGGAGMRLSVPLISVVVVCLCVAFVG